MPASPELLPLVSHMGQACGRHCSDYHGVSQATAPALASFRQHQLFDRGTAQVPPSPPHSFLWTQHCVDQGGLTHAILLTLPPRCWCWDRRQHHSWQEWTFLPGCFFLNQDPLSPESSSSPLLSPLFCQLSQPLYTCLESRHLSASLSLAMRSEPSSTGCFLLSTGD